MLGYCIMGIICTFLDILLWNMKMTSWKVQGKKSFFTFREWFDAISISLSNQFIFSWAAAIPSHLIQKSGIFRMNNQFEMSSLNDEFDLKFAFMHLAFCAFFIEVWFFTTHRALHWPPLFKAIHKKHHRFHAPTAVASMYEHARIYFVILFSIIFYFIYFIYLCTMKS